MDPQALIRRTEAARRLAIHPKTLDIMRLRGDMPCVEISPGQYRYRVADLDAWVANRVRNSVAASGSAQ